MLCAAACSGMELPVPGCRWLENIALAAEGCVYRRHTCTTWQHISRMGVSQTLLCEVCCCTFTVWQAVRGGTSPNCVHGAEMNDETLLEQLTRVKGIGAHSSMGAGSVAPWQLLCADTPRMLAARLTTCSLQGPGQWDMFCMFQLGRALTSCRSATGLCARACSTCTSSRSASHDPIFVQGLQGSCITSSACTCIHISGAVLRHCTAVL